MDDRDPGQRRGSHDRGRPDEDRDNTVIKPVFTPTIDLGHILQALVMAAATVGYVFTVSGNVTEANRKVDDLKLTMTQQFTDIRSELRAGLDAVHHQISGLPDTTARLSAVERRLDEVDRATAALGARLDVVDARSVKTEATLESVLPATRTELGPRHQ